MDACAFAICVSRLPTSWDLCPRESNLEDCPYLEEADNDAVLAYAARQVDHPIIAAK